MTTLANFLHFFRSEQLSRCLRLLSWGVLGLPLLAHALTQADLKPLAEDDFDAKLAVVDVLIQAPVEQTMPILQALQDESLVYDPGIGMLRQDGGRYVDALSGQEVTPNLDNLVSLSLNNRLRGKIESAASGLQLRAAEVNVRNQAIDALLQNTDSASRQLIEAARGVEKEADLKLKLDRLWAMVVLQTGNSAEKLQAVALLADEDSSQTKLLLAQLLEKGADGNWVEPDEKLRAAAQIALKHLQAQQLKGEILANLFTGLSLGSVLLLAALGLAITYGLIGVINMAHGEFLMIGAYATYVVQNLFRMYAPGAIEIYLLIALPAAFMASALVGFAIERLVLRHLYGRPLETLLATFGVSLLLMQGVRMVFGAQNVEVANPSWMSGGVRVMAGLTLPYNRLVILAFSLLVVAIAWAVLNRTRLGLFVRAVTQNRNMAACVGVKTWKVDSYAFAFGAGIAGLGGCALSQIGNVGPDLGQSYIIDSFMAVVLGGVGQLAGTVIGAFGLGIINKLIEPFYGAVLAKIFVLVLIVLFIQKRPQGLFALKGRSAEA